MAIMMTEKKELILFIPFSKKEKTLNDFHGCIISIQRFRYQQKQNLVKSAKGCGMKPLLLHFHKFSLYQDLDYNLKCCLIWDEEMHPKTETGSYKWKWNVYE